MATAQLHRVQKSTTVAETSNATATSQILSSAQSVELVQTLLHGSISCISYLRNLFSEKCFIDRAYNTSNTHWSYEDYVAGKNSNEQLRREKRRGSTRMKFLQRGHSRAADHFLDWLELGAFDALKLNVLHAMQLRIFEEPTHPENVIETYTFNIHYTAQPASHVKQVTNVEVKASQGSAATIKNVQTGLQCSLRSLIAYCNTLPILPDRRHLAMVLYYSKDSDQRYQPQGFQEAPDEKIFFPDNEIWKLCTHPAGSFSTGYHDVAVKIAHLDSEDPSVTEANGDKFIPGGLTYNKAIDHYADAVVDESDIKINMQLEANRSKYAVEMENYTEAGAKMVTKTAHETQAATTTDQHSIIQKSRVEGSRGVVNTNGSMDLDLDGIEAVQINYPQDAQDTLKSGSGAMEESQLPSQLTEDLRTKLHLHNMLQPSLPRDSLIPTQIMEEKLCISQSSRSFNDHAGNVSSRDPGESLPRFQDQPPVQSAVCFSQKKVGELNARRRRLARLPLLRVPRVGSQGPADIVDCQCDWNEEEDEMVECTTCNTWQHLHCYGYRGASDVRLPTEHACYKCLLEEKEAPLLKEMRSLAMVRRAIHIIENCKYVNDKNLAQALDCDLQTASRVAGRLRREGYLVPVANNTQKSTGASVKAKLEITSSGETFESLLKDYFDPTAKIAHLLASPLIEKFEPPEGETQATDMMANQFHVTRPMGTHGHDLRTHCPATPIRPTVTSPSIYPEILKNISPNIVTPTPRRSKRIRNEGGGSPAAPLTKRRRMRSCKTKDYIDVGQWT